MAEQSNQNRDTQPAPPPPAERTTPRAQPSRRSRIWLLLLLFLVLAVTAGVIVQGVFLYKVYQKVDRTSRSLADEILSLSKTDVGGLGVQPGQGNGGSDSGQGNGDAGESLGLLQDLLSRSPGGTSQEDLQSLQDLLGGLLGETPTVRRTPAAVLQPPADVYDAGDRFVVLLNMPGAAPTTIQAQAEGTTLTISADVQDMAPADVGGRQVLNERTRGAYRRRIPLPSAVASGAAPWKYDLGVLVVTVPKA